MDDVTHVADFYEICIVVLYKNVLRINKSSDVVRVHHVTRHNTPIHNILSTAPQLSIYQEALRTLPEDGNVMPKHLGATIHN
jgi:hypothetical protein